MKIQLLLESVEPFQTFYWGQLEQQLVELENSEMYQIENVKTEEQTVVHALVQPLAPVVLQDICPKGPE